MLQTASQSDALQRIKVVNNEAKMHVDKNNVGPSFIIALEHYTEGELWIYDPKENVRVNESRSGSFFL